MPQLTPPRILIIGAGSRGHAYARAIAAHPTRGRVAGVAEPVAYKREEFRRRYGASDSGADSKNTASGFLVLSDWREILTHPEVAAGVDGFAICTLDETHAEIVLALRRLNKHLLCEKPLATTLADCRAIYAAITDTSSGYKPILFAIGHVLRYSPHNVLLHQLVVADKAVGDIVNINHTEPVGYWHFAHSYVRGNWRKGAPSLLTKCCHDVDLLLWLGAPSAPTHVSSHGSLVHFRRSQKPASAGAATNCFACAAEPDCIYSARKIYIDHALRASGSVRGWPNSIVAPEIEEAPTLAAAEQLLVRKLSAADADADAGGGGAEGPDGPTDGAPYGRCVYETDNDVVDNQVVVFAFPRMTATLTMVAHTEHICERFTRIYGTRAELTADSHSIRIYDFATARTRVYTPADMDVGSGHGGGDTALALAFVDAIAAVKAGDMSVDQAQQALIRCTPSEALRSHEAVFWAEQARLDKKVLEWNEWVASSNV